MLELNGKERFMPESDLKKAGLKVTLPRLKILAILESNERKHVSAEEIYKIFIERGDEIGIATVYRVLTQFEASGIVTRHRFDGDSSVFELSSGPHHDHLVCIKCDKVVEFVDEVVERRQRELAERNSFEITDHSLIIYGLCSDCRVIN